MWSPSVTVVMMVVYCAVLDSSIGEFPGLNVLRICQILAPQMDL
jgi:hypothetical protein